MVVNTGRAASRAVYLNLKNQPSVHACGRRHFDHIARSYISNGDTRPLDQLTRELKSLQDGDSKNNRTVAITFHGARPILAYPFDSTINKQFLTDVRTCLDVQHVFMIVRQPLGLLKSELNRQIAAAYGNWDFQFEGANWRRDISIDDLLGIHDASTFSPGGSHRAVRKFVVEDLARKISTRTGKPYAMYSVFAEVFPHVHVVDYEALVRRPVDVYERMGEIAGFHFENASLANVGLNGLANRLLCYNPINVWSNTFSRENATVRFINSLRKTLCRKINLRFEISEIVEMCDDWGSFKSLNLHHTDCLPKVASELGVPIGIGIRDADFEAAKEAGEAKELETVLRDAVRPLSALFEHNYCKARSLYRGVYIKDVPRSICELFWDENHDQYQALRKLMDSELAEFQAPDPMAHEVSA